jgi:hypothetical protein
MSYSNSITHKKNGNKTLCGKFFSPYMTEAEDYSCRACMFKHKKDIEMNRDIVFVTVSGVTYQMALKNLKRYMNALLGKEYKVSKRHEGSFSKYVDFEKNYGLLKTRRATVKTIKQEIV